MINVQRPGGGASTLLTTVVEDDFNRADSSTIGAPQIGKTPLEYAGNGALGSGNWKILSNQLASEGSVAENYIFWDTGLLNKQITATIATVHNAGGIWVAAAIDSDQRITGMMVYPDTGNNRYQLYYRHANGSFILQVNSTGVTPANGDVLIITVDRGEITVNINGTDRITGRNQMPHGTWVGFREASGTTSRYDSLKVTTYP